MYDEQTIDQQAFQPGDSEDADIALERLAYHHVTMAEAHRREAEHFYRLAEEHREKVRVSQTTVNRADSE